LERRQVVVLFAGGIIIALMVFVLGIGVGKYMAKAPERKFENDLAMRGLEPEIPKPVPSASAEAAKPQTGDAAIKQKIEQQKPPDPVKPAKGETVSKGKEQKPFGKEKPGAKETAKAPQPAPATPVKPGEIKKPETKPVPAQPVTAPIMNTKPGTPVAKPVETKPVALKPGEINKTYEAKPVTTQISTMTPAKPAENKPGTAKPVETKPPVTKPAEPAVAKPVASPTAQKGGFAIQVSAYPDKSTADELVNKLKANKWPAYFTTTQVPGKGTYYRVNLGPYSSRDQATRALAIFKSKEPKHKDSFVKALD